MSARDSKLVFGGLVLAIGLAAVPIAGLVLRATASDGALDGGTAGWGLPAEAGQPVVVVMPLETLEGATATLIDARPAKASPGVTFRFFGVRPYPRCYTGAYVGADFDCPTAPLRGLEVAGRNFGGQTSNWWLGVSLSAEVPGAYAVKDIDVRYRIGSRTRTARLPASLCYLAVAPAARGAVFAELKSRGEHPSTLLPGSTHAGVAEYLNSCAAT